MLTTIARLQEIALWFKEGEVISWKSAQQDWVYEKP
jgi:nucleoside-diphosphate kinase